MRKTIAQRLLLLGCYPPPGKPASQETAYQREGQTDPLRRVRKVFGSEIDEAIKGSVCVDIGCGAGYQTVAIAKAGAARAVGVDIRPHFAKQEAKANEDADLKGRTEFTISPIRSLGEGWADLVLSSNSFEHFDRPDEILEDALHVLKPGGRFFITFGPPWKHPFGVHHYFMIRAPWMHLVFSERTVMEARKLFHPDEDRSNYSECLLNQMTIRKFRRYVDDSGFRCEKLFRTPISVVPKAINALLPEYTTAHVSAVLVKP